MSRLRRRPTRSLVSPYERLRTAALTTSLNSLSEPVPRGVRVIGAVIDIPTDGGFETILALADGTASLFTSTDGGTIGGGGRPEVAAASQALVEVLNEQLVHQLPRDERSDLPDADHAQITLLTRASRRRGLVEADIFWGRAPSTIPDVLAAIHAVLTSLRDVSPPAG